MSASPDHDRKEKSSVSEDLPPVGTADLARYASNRDTTIVTKEGDVVNASGHRDQLQRHYGLLSICGLALTIDNAWVALGGSLTVSIRE